MISMETMEYRSVPPKRRVTMNTNFILKGKGEPKPYPVDDDYNDEVCKPEEEIFGD